MDEIEFNYIGEEDTLDDDNLNEDFEVRTVRVNKDGKKARGKDLNWAKKCNYNNPKSFEDSNILDELKENYQVMVNLVLKVDSSTNPIKWLDRQSQ